VVKTNNMNKCDWCGKGTKNKEHYTAMSPLNESYEKLIKGFDKKYGQFWYDSKEIDPKLLDDVMTYDQATNTVGRGIICNGCHEKDEVLYQKYRQLTATKDGDPYGMLKIVVDDDEVNYDIDKMEMWYEDIKDKQSKVGEAN
tara:strand:+ start:110 stop:535 length:426 start_codon:yes stop_codon:yes gene_type:complete